MKIGIYASLDNGDVYDKDIDYIAVENGYNHLKRQNIIPKLVIGDFDTLSHKMIKDTLLYFYPTHKDESDTHLAIQYAINNHYDEIDIYGVIGERLDHFLSILCLLECYKHYKIHLYNQRQMIFVIDKGLHHINMKHYYYFSLFSFDKAIISLSHCDYPLDYYSLNRQDNLCLSNQAKDYFTIKTSTPVLCLLSTHEKTLTK